MVSPLYTALPIEEQYELARRVVKQYRLSPEDAEDVIQDALVAGWLSNAVVGEYFVKRKVRQSLVDLKRRQNSKPRGGSGSRGSVAKVRTVSMDRPLSMGGVDDGIVALSDTIADPKQDVEEMVMHRLILQEIERLWPGRIDQYLSVSNAQESAAFNSWRANKYYRRNAKWLALDALYHEDGQHD